MLVDYVRVYEQEAPSMPRSVERGCLLLRVVVRLFLRQNPSPPLPPKPHSGSMCRIVYRVNLDTSKGAVVVEVTRAWAPHGADHFFELVKTGYYDGDRFYRVVPRFVVQFGINGDPKVSQLWSSLRIPDDPVKQKNRKGTVTFASSGSGRAHHPGICEYARQPVARSPGLRAVRAGGRMAWRCWNSSMAATATCRRAAAVRTA